MVPRAWLPGHPLSHVTRAPAARRIYFAAVNSCISRRHAPVRDKRCLIGSQTGSIRYQVMHMSARARDPRVPSPFDRRRLSVATLGISDAAITRAYRAPESVRESTLLRLRRAAGELGLPLPGEHSEVKK